MWTLNHVPFPFGARLGMWLVWGYDVGVVCPRGLFGRWSWRVWFGGLISAPATSSHTPALAEVQEWDQMGTQSVGAAHRALHTGGSVTTPNIMGAALINFRGSHKAGPGKGGCQDPAPMLIHREKKAGRRTRGAESWTEAGGRSSAEKKTASSVVHGRCRTPLRHLPQLRHPLRPPFRPSTARTATPAWPTRKSEAAHPRPKRAGPGWERKSGPDRW